MVKMNRDNKVGNTVRNSLISGSVAGITSTTLFHPFDVVRTKMQSSLTSTTAVNARGEKKIPSAKAAFSSPKAAFQHTVQNGGLRSLYTGLSLPVTAQAVYKATVFTVNNVSRSLLLDFKKKNSRYDPTMKNPPIYKLSLLDSYICGFIGGAVNGFLFVSPVEFVRNQLISQHSRIAFERELRLSQHTSIGRKEVLASVQSNNISSISNTIMKGPTDVIRQVLKKDGLFGLWRGAKVTVARDSIGCGFFFLVFEIGKQKFSNVTGENTLLTTIISGSISGVAFWCAALPFDTMKTIIQNGSANSMTSAISKVGGLKNLLKGWQVAIGKGAPGAAVTIGTYEYVNRYLTH